jgi:hypothetical protein
MCNSLQQFVNKVHQFGFALRFVHQFVNKVHQIVTTGAFQTALVGNQKCVVEHKGWDRLCVFVSIALIARAFTRPTIRYSCPAFVGRLIFRQNNAVPHPLRHFLYRVEEPMPKRSIRLTDAIDQRIQSAAKLRGYSTPSAFLRAAM